MLLGGVGSLGVFKEVAVIEQIIVGIRSLHNSGYLNGFKFQLSLRKNFGVLL